jgi:DNA-binding transcriptional regulator PaaX
MKQRRQKRDPRALSAETMFIFLKTISALKRKVSVPSVITKIQTKNVNLRPRRANEILHHLQKDSYIRLERGVYPILTEKGRVYLESIAQKQKTHWDKRFRIILFESLKTSRNNREYIRTKIKDYGFMHLERGVWIYPYACDAFIRLLELEYKLESPLMHIVAQDNETMLPVRKHFRLR